MNNSGVKLLITIDCGITDTEEITHANEHGIDVIVTDHHIPLKKGGGESASRGSVSPLPKGVSKAGVVTPLLLPNTAAPSLLVEITLPDEDGGHPFVKGDSLPSAFAILNPKQSDCSYPEKMLCGSGVVFKLVQGLLAEIRRQPTTYDLQLTTGWEKWLLDMVGLATLSDMVPLTGENRVFAYYGLKVLKKSPRKGLNELISVLKLNRADITEDDIGFSISPRINAASRMGIRWMRSACLRQPMTTKHPPLQSIWTK